MMNELTPPVEATNPITKEYYNDLLVAAHEIASDDKFNLKTFIEHTVSTQAHAEDPNSKDYLAVTVTEVLANVVDRAETASTTEQLRTQIQEFEPDVREFLRQCVTTTEDMPVAKEYWTDKGDVAHFTLTNDIILDVLAEKQVE